MSAAPGCSKWLLSIAAALLLPACASWIPTPPPTGDIDWRPPALAPHSRPLLAVALSGGTRRGYAHIGVVRAFERAGLKPDIIVGTSVGAIVGSLWAAGVSADAMELAARELDAGVLSDWSPSVWQLTRGQLKGLAGGRDLIAFVARHTGGKRIEDLPTRFAAVASDLHRGTSVILNHGDTALAVRASSGVPLAFAPVRAMVAGQWHELIDGAMAQPVPVAAARALGADYVVAVDVVYRPEEARVSNPLDVTFQTLQIVIHSLGVEQVRRADWLIQPEVHERMIDAGEHRHLIDLGEAAAAKALPLILSALERWPR